MTEKISDKGEAEITVDSKNTCAGKGGLVLHLYIDDELGST
jgi:hypothetical protein